MSEYLGNPLPRFRYRGKPNGLLVEAADEDGTSRRWKNTNVRRTNGKNIRNKMKENKCGQCHYFRAKDGACRNRKMRNECFPDDKDEILYVSRDERQCALFKPRKAKYEPKTCNKKNK